LLKEKKADNRFGFCLCGSW